MIQSQLIVATNVIKHDSDEAVKNVMFRNQECHDPKQLLRPKSED